MLTHVPTPNVIFRPMDLGPIETTFLLLLVCVAVVYISAQMTRG